MSNYRYGDPIPDDIIESTINLILDRFETSFERARELAINALEVLVAKGGAIDSEEQIISVIDVVVKRWIEEDLMEK